jgi:TonB family protein
MDEEAFSGSDGTWELSEVDEQPALSNRSEVARLMQRNYPPLLRDAGVAGSVTLRMRVRADGRVDPESISVETSTHDAFSDASRPIAQRMRFRPAMRGGSAVASWVGLPITFELPR